MKKPLFAIYVLATVFWLSLASFPPAANAESDGHVYAQIKSPAVLYFTDGENYSPFVTLPATYFVELVGEETDEEYLAVSYLDISGYIKKSDVEITDYEPVTKYASPLFTASNEGLSAILRSSPNHDGDNVLALIPDGTKLLCYGFINGSARYEGTSTVWYYVKYETQDAPLYGYVYSYHGTAEPVADNVVEKVVKPEPAPAPSQAEDPTEPEPESPKIRNASDTVFIICLCIPAVLIMLLLFRSPQPRKRRPRNYRE